MTMTFSKSTEPVIGHHLNALNSRLAAVFPSMKEAVPEQGLCRSEVNDGFVATTFEVTRGGRFSLATSTDSGFDPSHYQLVGWRNGYPLTTCDTKPWNGDTWQLDIKTFPVLLLDRITLESVADVAIKDVRQLGHRGWLPIGAIRWGDLYKTSSSEAKVISLAWIEPGATLAIESTNNPYFAELTKYGWVVNSRCHTLCIGHPPLRPMIAARATHEYPKNKPGFVG